MSIKSQSIMLDALASLARKDDDPNLAEIVRKQKLRLAFKVANPMYQIPTEVRNKIAATGLLKHPFYRKIMPMAFEEMDRELDKLTGKLQSAGVPNSVIVAYMYIAPLLAEHRAISHFVYQGGGYEYRSLLPEILDPKEAINIAKMDYSLSEHEEWILLGLFQGVLIATESN